jgi:hypothetical protein
MAQVFSKSPKGLLEATGKTSELDAELLEVLKACKDNQTADEIAASWPEADRPVIVWAVGELVSMGYLREVFGVRRESTAARRMEAGDAGEDLDFSAITIAPAPAPVAEPVQETRPVPEPEPEPAPSPPPPPPAAPTEPARAVAAPPPAAPSEPPPPPAAEAPSAAPVQPEAGSLAERLRAGLASRRGQRDAQAVGYIRRSEEEARRRAEEEAAKEAAEQARVEAARQAKREADEKVRREQEEKARREAVDRIRREALEKLRREEEEKARREAEEAERRRREAEERARREAEEAERRRREEEERIRREEEERIRRAAEEQARREAEERARIEAEERARREEQARREAEERARIEAEERARREEEERIRREAEERARRKAEEKARREAEERARLEEEERDRQRIQERLAERRLKRNRQSRIAGVLMLVVLPVAILFMVRFLPFDGKRQAFEAAASAALGVPVKARAAHVELLPAARLTLDDVVIGEGDDRIAIRQVALGAPYSVLWSMPAEFSSLHLAEPRLSPAALVGVLGAAPAKLPLKSAGFSASGLVLASTPVFLPPLAVDAKFADGGFAAFSARGEDADSGPATLAGERTADGWKLSLSAQRLALPFAAKLRVTDASASAVLAGGRLAIGEFKGWINQGEISGNATLGWQDGWRLAGKLAVKRMDAATTAPGWLADGVFDGQGDFLAISPKAQELLPRAQLQGRVEMARGVLAKVDLDRIVQGRGQGEQFAFDSLKGSLSYDAGRIELSDIRLTAGELAATGGVAVGADQAAKGRIQIEVRSGRGRFGGSLSVGGSATAPNYQR